MKLALLKQTAAAAKATQYRQNAAPTAATGAGSHRPQQRQKAAVSQEQNQAVTGLAKKTLLQDSQSQSSCLSEAGADTDTSSSSSNINGGLNISAKASRAQHKRNKSSQPGPSRHLDKASTATYGRDAWLLLQALTLQQPTSNQQQQQQQWQRLEQMQSASPLAMQTSVHPGRQSPTSTSLAANASTAAATVLEVQPVAAAPAQQQLGQLSRLLQLSQHPVLAAYISQSTLKRGTAAGKATAQAQAATAPLQGFEAFLQQLHPSGWPLLPSLDLVMQQDLTRQQRQSQQESQRGLAVPSSEASLPGNTVTQPSICITSSPEQTCKAVPATAATQQLPSTKGCRTAQQRSIFSISQLLKDFDQVQQQQQQQQQTSSQGTAAAYAGEAMCEPLIAGRYLLVSAAEHTDSATVLPCWEFTGSGCWSRSPGQGPLAAVFSRTTSQFEHQGQPEHGQEVGLPSYLQELLETRQQPHRDAALPSIKAAAGAVKAAAAAAMAKGTLTVQDREDDRASRESTHCTGSPGGGQQSREQAQRLLLQEGLKCSRGASTETAAAEWTEVAAAMYCSSDLNSRQQPQPSGPATASAAAAAVVDASDRITATKSCLQLLQQLELQDPAHEQTTTATDDAATSCKGSPGCGLQVYGLEDDDASPEAPQQQRVQQQLAEQQQQHDSEHQQMELELAITDKWPAGVDSSQLEVVMLDDAKGEAEAAAAIARRLHQAGDGCPAVAALDVFSTMGTSAGSAVVEQRGPSAVSPSTRQQQPSPPLALGQAIGRSGPPADGGGELLIVQCLPGRQVQQLSTLSCKENQSGTCCRAEADDDPQQQEQQHHHHHQGKLKGGSTTSIKQLAGQMTTFEQLTERQGQQLEECVLDKQGQQRPAEDVISVSKASRYVPRFAKRQQRYQQLADSVERAAAAAAQVAANKAVEQTPEDTMEIDDDTNEGTVRAQDGMKAGRVPVTSAQQQQQRHGLPHTFTAAASSKTAAGCFTSLQDSNLRGMRPLLLKRRQHSRVSAAAASAASSDVRNAGIAGLPEAGTEVGSSEEIEDNSSSDEAEVIRPGHHPEEQRGCQAAAAGVVPILSR
jgi:hypothetical protein